MRLAVLIVLLIPAALYGQGNRQVDTFAALTNLFPDPSQPIVETRGYWQVGDGGDAAWRLHTTWSGSIDGYYAVRHPRNTSYVLALHNWNGDLRALGWTGSGGTNDTARLNAAITAARTHGPPIVWAPGTEYRIVGNDVRVLAHSALGSLIGTAVEIDHDTLRVHVPGGIRVGSSNSPAAGGDITYDPDSGALMTHDGSAATRVVAVRADSHGAPGYAPVWQEDGTVRWQEVEGGSSTNFPPHTHDDYVQRAGDTMTGPLQVGSTNASHGFTRIVPGGSTAPGYYSFFAPGGDRVGHVGWKDNSGNYLQLQTESGWNWTFTAQPYVGTNRIWHAGNDGSGSGLDADLLDGLDSDDFAAADHLHDDRYLRLTGGTVTGPLFLRPSSSDGSVVIAGGADSAPGHVDFRTPEGIVGFLGSRDGTNQWLRISSQPGWLWSFTTTPLVGSNTVWHAGNDGSGSGLDADTVDGQHASAFALSDHDHDAADITTGIMDPARLGVGSPTTNTFLRGDGVWADVAGDSGIPDAPVDGQFYGRRNASWDSPVFADLAQTPTTLSGYGITDAAPLIHTHHATNIVDGVFPPERLGTGTPDGNTFLSGTGEWVVPPGGLPDAPNNGFFYGRKSGSWERPVFNDLTSTPTTVEGYGITNAATKAELQSHAEIGAGVHGISAFGATLIDDSSASAARATLELGSAALADSEDFAPAIHDHDAADITSGVLAPARLGSGTASTNTFLRGDSEWVSIPGGLEDAPNDGAAYLRKSQNWVKPAFADLVSTPTNFQGYGIYGGILPGALSHGNRSLQGWFKYKSSGAGGSTDDHWKIATLQESAPTQGNVLYVRAIGGRYLASNKGIIEVMIANRGGERFSYWLRGEKPDQTGIKVYREEDGKLSVYAFLGGGTNNFNGIGVDAMMGNWENPGAFFSEVYVEPVNVGPSPTGTLVFDSRSATPDFHIPYQGTPQVRGTNVSIVGHTHAASAITSGTIATARLGSGTANSNTFLRGDQTWASIDAVPSSRTITAGTGLTGGGDLSANRTLSANFGTTAGTIAEGNHTHPADDITSGTLPVARGGTGHTNYTIGDLLYASASGTLTRLGIGTAGQVLTVNGAGNAPSWETPSSGGGSWAEPFATVSFTASGEEQGGQDDVVGAISVEHTGSPGHYLITLTNNFPVSHFYHVDVRYLSPEGSGIGYIVSVEDDSTNNVVNIHVAQTGGFTAPFQDGMKVKLRFYAD